MKEYKKNIWFISKYCRLPSKQLNYEDVIQVKGAYPSRAFSILRCLARDGYDCTLFVARHKYTLFNTDQIPSKEICYIDGIRVVILNVLPFVKTQSLARILGWIHFEIKLLFIRTKDFPRPDHIVASSLSILSILNGFIFRQRYKSQLIFEVRDIWPLVLTENGGFNRFNPFVLILSFVEWLGYKFSDQIVATMPNLEKHVSNILGYSRKVHCIPMGITEEMLAEESESFIVSNLNKNLEHKFVVTYLGSIGVDNALNTFFEAAKLLINEKKIIFKVFGKGDLLTKYKSDCKHLNNVIFEGAIPNNMVQSALTNSSILYFATHPTKVLDYGQSLNKIIDYMFSGKPILASHSGYKSMINESECGYFIPAGNVEALCKEILHLSNKSPTDLEKMGARGKDWLLKNRTYDSLARKYISILNSYQ